ncbi:MAG: LysR family transcriptional regulator [Pseudomonadota bacterium]
MDWRSVTFDWNRARAFLVTAEEGSLSAAAAALGTTQPTVGRQVAALEAELGLILFERFGRGLQLTPSGLELAEHVRAMAEAANLVSLAASGRSQSIEGSIRLSTTEVAAAFILPPLIEKLRDAEPGITVEIVASNDLSDLRRREADIALRSVRPTDQDLIARKLRDDEARLYAAKAYLAQTGPLTSPAALSKATFIGFEENAAYLAGLNGLGLSLTADHFPIRCTSHLVQWNLVKQGLGIGVMPTLIADPDPEVQRAAPWLKPFSYETWLVSHRELRTSRRVRLVYDWLAEALQRL